MQPGQVVPINLSDYEKRVADGRIQFMRHSAGVFTMYMTQFDQDTGKPSEFPKQFPIAIAQIKKQKADLVAAHEKTIAEIDAFLADLERREAEATAGV